MRKRIIRTSVGGVEARNWHRIVKSRHPRWLVKWYYLKEEFWYWLEVRDTNDDGWLSYLQPLRRRYQAQNCRNFTQYVHGIDHWKYPLPKRHFERFGDETIELRLDHIQRPFSAELEGRIRNLSPTKYAEFLATIEELECGRQTLGLKTFDHIFN